MRRNIRPVVGPGNPYLDRIIAYIPTEVIATYTAIRPVLFCVTIAPDGVFQLSRTFMKHGIIHAFVTFLFIRHLAL